MNERSGASVEKNSAPSPWIAFFTALRFLTIIPVRWRGEYDVQLFRESIFFFPAVALLIGGIGTTVVLLAGGMLPMQITVFLLMVYLAGISGFLHIDGLADSADGLFCARPAEAALKIMKDSRIGAMGVVVLILVLLGKYIALSLLGLNDLAAAALILPLAGRSAILLTMASQPYGRKEGGLGELFYSSRSRLAALMAIALLFVVCCWVSGLTPAFVVCVSVIITVILFSWFCRSRLGGVTGDTLGAVCELTELTAAITICSL